MSTEKDIRVRLRIDRYLLPALYDELCAAPARNRPSIIIRYLLSRGAPEVPAAAPAESTGFAAPVAASGDTDPPDAEIKRQVALQIFDDFEASLDDTQLN